MGELLRNPKYGKDRLFEAKSTAYAKSTALFEIIYEENIDFLSDLILFYKKMLESKFFGTDI